MVITVWLLVLFLNGEPVVPDQEFPDELIFDNPKTCKEWRDELLERYDDVRCVEALLRKRIRT